MIDLKIENNKDEFKISLPTSLVLKKQALEDLTEIIRIDIDKNLSDGTGLDGVALEPKLKGGRLFYKTGTLLKSVDKRVFHNEARVFIKPNRNVIASYLQTGTNTIPARQFFGISQRALIQTDRYLMSHKVEEMFDKRF